MFTRRKAAKTVHTSETEDMYSDNVAEDGANSLSSFVPPDFHIMIVCFLSPCTPKCIERKVRYWLEREEAPKIHIALRLGLH